ncbi:hypothetical protein [Arthrobacter woluwensis]|jgi:hypothetical protein|uniref:hypothetical protein n=1 Tax=Arthrobacter woluwensis TaxID=156980 RepID=UPI0038176159
MNTRTGDRSWSIRRHVRSDLELSGSPVRSRQWRELRESGPDAVPERLEIKVPLWGEVDRLARPRDLRHELILVVPRLMDERIRDK